MNGLHASGTSGSVQLHFPEVDDRELHFLILQHLRSGPCSRAAEILLEEATAKLLLPTRTDIFGQEHRMSYDELSSQHGKISPNLLRDILSQRLLSKRSSSSLFANLDTLLGSGACSLAKAGLPGQRKQLAAPDGLVRKLLDRGVAGRGVGETGIKKEEAPKLLAGRMAHQKTVRGHHLPIYCLAFDRTGRWLISGSDDHLVKIWSMQTAMLQMACRGHTAEITDLAVSCDNWMLASSSNDHSIRIWDLSDDCVGHPVSTLLGHTFVVSFIDFHPTVPEILLSSSLDGTCRLWNACHGGAALHILMAEAEFGPARPFLRAFMSTRSEDVEAAIEASATAPLTSSGSTGPAGKVLLEVCSFSPDGTYIAAGANDCACYLWAWENFGSSWHRSCHGSCQSSTSSCKTARMWGNVERWLEMPSPVELCRLPGHKNDVLLLQFSNDGSAFATGSKDGTLRVWRRPSRRGQPVRGVWQTDLTLASPVDEAAIAQARRRRRPPPNLSVNQLAWAKDDSKIMASVSDNSIVVWDARSGEQQVQLKGHQGNIHVLEGHPHLLNVVMSASYDGQTIIWDIHSCTQLACFSSQDTRLGEGRWVEPLHLMDGHWTVDGLGVVVTDSAGQLHFYGSGDGSNFARAKYDQFVEGEMRVIERDLNGFALDADEQIPPHLSFKTDRLTDYVGEPYPTDYQEAWKQGRLWQLTVAQAQANTNGSSQIPAALHIVPPLLSAAAWQAQERGADPTGIQTAVVQVQERQVHADMEPPEPVPEAVAEVAQPEAEATAAAPHIGQPQAVGVSTRRAHRDARDASVELSDMSDSLDPFDGEFEEIVGAENISRAERLAMRNRRRDELLEERQRQRQSRRAQKRRRERDSEMPESRKRLRSSRLAEEFAEDESMDSMDIDHDDEELFELDEDEQPRRLRSSATNIRERRSERASRRAERRRAGPGTAPRLGFSANARGRPAKAYAWLQDSKHRPGVYVPQMEDDVVYIWNGHKQFLDNTNAKEQGPWAEFGGQEGELTLPLRPAEQCRVVALHYTIALDSAADTFATVRLRLTDAASLLYGKEFDVDIPPSHLGQAEFVIAKSRFEVSARRGFAVGERCKIFYPDEGERGQWWRGTILTDKLQEAPSGSRENPYAAALWERFTVVWDEQTSSGEALQEDQMTTEHAAWEMFDEAALEAEVTHEGPRLAEEVSARALAAVETYLQRKAYDIFAAVPEPSERFPTSDGKGVLYYNQIVELPMSLLIIQARLQGCYYRQAAALKHDVHLLAANARKFNGQGSEIEALAARLAARIVAAADGVEQSPSEDEQPELEEEEEEEATAQWRDADSPESELPPLRRRLRLRRNLGPAAEEGNNDSPFSQPSRGRRSERRRGNYAAMAWGEDEEDESLRGSEEPPSLAVERRPRRERQEVRRYSPGPEASRPRYLTRAGSSLRPRRYHSALLRSTPGAYLQASRESSEVQEGPATRLRSRGGAAQQDPPAGDASEEEPILSECEADETFASREPGSSRGLTPEAERPVPADAGEEAEPPAEEEPKANGVSRGDGRLRVRLRTGSRVNSGRCEGSAGNQGPPNALRASPPPSLDSSRARRATKGSSEEMQELDVDELEAPTVLRTSTRLRSSRPTLRSDSSRGSVERGTRKSAKAGRTGLRHQNRPSYREMDDPHED